MDNTNTNTNNNKATLQDFIDRAASDIYKAGNTSAFNAVVNKPLVTLREAAGKAAGYLSDYRRALRYGVTGPNESASDDDDTKAVMAGTAGGWFGKPGDIEVVKARQNLDKLQADVDDAEAQINTSAKQVRRSLSLGDGRISQDAQYAVEEGQTGLLVQRLIGVETEVGRGMPRLRTALSIVRESLQTAQGGAAMALPGWDQEDSAYVAEKPYTPDPERVWYSGMGGID